MVWFIFRLAIITLAAFRLSEMFAIDDGPFCLFLKLRMWLAKSPPYDKNLKQTLSQGIQCRHCNGVWFAILLTPFAYYPNHWADIIITAIAIMGVQSILVNKFGRPE